MAFIDRVVEFPGRVQLTNVSGDVYDMVRAEGAEYTEGTLLNAANLNQQTQLDGTVETLYTTAGMVAGTYQNEVSDALGFVCDAITTYGFASNLTAAFSLGSSAAKLPLKDFIGNGCSLSSNGIKVNNAGVYEVSATAYYYTGFTVNDTVHLLVYKNSTVIADNGMRIPTANPYENLNISPIIVNLAANDVVYLYAYNQSGARGTVAASSSRTCFALKRIY